MKKDILISFVIPCYNSEPYMHIAVDSLLKADTSRIEIIIVDDGSKDKTGMIADAYQNKYPEFIKAIHQENGGHGEGINVGVKEAKGLYFKVLDSDDWVDENALNQLLDEIEKYNRDVDLFLCNYVYYHGYENRKRVITYKSVMESDKILEWKDVGHFKLNQNITLHSVMYKTSIIRESKVVLPKHVSYEDNYFVYAPMQFCHKIVYLDVTLYCYLIGRDGQSVSREQMIKKFDQNLLISELINNYCDVYKFKKSDYRLFRILYHHIHLVAMIGTIYTRLSKDKNAKVIYKKYWKDLKKSNKKLYNKLRHFSYCACINVPTIFGKWFMYIMWKIAMRVVPFN